MTRMVKTLSAECDYCGKTVKEGELIYRLWGWFDETEVTTQPQEYPGVYMHENGSLGFDSDMCNDCAKVYQSILPTLRGKLENQKRVLEMIKV